MFSQRHRKEHLAVEEREKADQDDQGSKHLLTSDPVIRNKHVCKSCRVTKICSYLHVCVIEIPIHLFVILVIRKLYKLRIFATKLKYIIHDNCRL